MERDAVFACPGEMARLSAAFDWASTSLGPVHEWSPALRTATATLLRSRFPMCLSWGPDLVLLYNDAFVATLERKHPAALGARIEDVFPEIWDEVGYQQYAVLAGGEATYAEALPLVLEMGSGPEETFYTFGYSHVPEDPPGVRGPGGVLATVASATAAVVGARRMALLNDLAGATRDVADRDDAARATIAVLARADRDLQHAALLLPDADGTLVPAGSFGPADAPTVRLPLREGRHEGELVVSPHPLRPLDDEHERFLRLLADHVGQALSLATTRGEEQQRLASLAAADRAKSTFLSHVSHELRTPLQLLLAPLDDALATGHPVAGDDVAAMHRSAHRLLRMVDGLLEVTRVGAAPRAPAPEPTDVVRVTADLVRPFVASAVRAGLELRTTLDPAVGVVELDPELWETVLTNLVANAVKYTPAGHVDVRLTAADGVLELRVADTGIGILAAEHDRVFRRFHRVAGPAARAVEGTGIGLTLVADAVDALGGSIDLDSEPDVGSTFVVRLPLVATSAAAVATSVDTRAAALAADIAPQEQSLPPVADDDTRPVVLVVDDNAGMRALLARVVAGLGPVVTCRDGREALDVLRTRPVGLVVTDVMMPRLDGVGLVRALRADPTTAQVPVVVVSARAESGSATEALAAGADDYVVKPFTRDELLARCRGTMELAALRASRAAESARTSMLAGISHDMQTPLSVITGALEVLGHPELDDAERRSLLARAGDRAGQLERLVSELLDWSRLATGKRIEGRREPVGVVELVETAAARHACTRVVLGDGDGDGDARDVVVQVDRVRTERVLHNLLDNAHDAARAAVQVEIEVGDDVVSVHVVDDGPGIDPGVVADLFSTTGPPASSGLGLGLHVSREAARAQGGDVVLSSTGPTGTRFDLVLPRERPPGG